MANTRVKARIDGILSPKGFDKYSKEVKKEMLRAYKVSMPPAIKDMKNYLGDISKQFFNIKQKTFKNMYTSSRYDKKTGKLPTVLFYTRSSYWNIFSTGGNLKPKNAKGLIVPLDVGGARLYQRRNGKKAFLKLLKTLRDSKKSFWKKVNGNLILFAITDTTTNRTLGKYRKNYKTRNGVKRIKKGSVIPIAILKSKVYIRQRFKYNELVKNKYIPTFLSQFNRNLSL